MYIFTTGLTADAITYNTLINACARAADAESSAAFESALQVLQVLSVLALLALLVLKSMRARARRMPSHPLRSSPHCRCCRYSVCLLYLLY
jgi:hypothetical protein